MVSPGVIDNPSQGVGPSSFAWKESCRLATTVDIVLSGIQTIDGILGVDGNRILVKDQTDQTENGIYVMAAGAWARASDSDTGTSLEMAATFVEEGDTNADQLWIQVTDNITLGVSNIIWVKYFEDKFAATRIVDKAGKGTDLTIQSAINNLPAAGGAIYVKDGTYAITSSIVLPNKPVKIVGCGDATIIDLTDYAISAFTIGYNQVLAFSDIKINGDGSSGQIAFSISDNVNAAIPMVFSRVSVNNIEKVFVVGSSSYASVTYNDSAVTFAARATSILWSGGSGAVVLHNVTATNDGANYRGGISGDPYVWISDSNIAFIATSSVSAMWASASTFLGSFTITSVRSQIVGCNHSSYSVARRIDLAAGATNTIIKGCKFNDWTNEAIRVAASNCIIEGNENCKITETGTPTGNLYSNNLGISGSTLVGSNCRIDPENYRNVMTFGAIGDGTTNDRAAIQAAIDALPAAGGVVYFPPGTYYVATALVLPNKNVQFKGAGSSSIINIKTNVINLFTAAYTKDYHFEDLEFLADSDAGQNLVYVTSSATVGLTFVRANICGTSSYKGFDIGVEVSSGRAFLTLKDSSWNYMTVAMHGWGNVTAYNFYTDGAFTDKSGYRAFVYAENCIFDVYYDWTIAESTFLNCLIYLDEGYDPTITINPDIFGGAPQVRFEFCEIIVGDVLTLMIDVGAVPLMMIGNSFGDDAGPVRTAGIGGRFIGNENLTIVETGSADYNFYSGNVYGFAPTIIGASSRIEGVHAGNSDEVMEGMAKANLNLTAVGNVGAGEDDLITYTLPAEALMKTGSGVRIKAWGTAANNGNAKTLKAYFGGQLILTYSLTTSQAGLWEINAIVGKTGSNTQDYHSRLDESPNDQVHQENGTGAQTDTNAIVIKCTGEATANNDIVQEGMLVEVMN